MDGIFLDYDMGLMALKPLRVSVQQLSRRAGKRGNFVRRRGRISNEDTRRRAGLDMDSPALWPMGVARGGNCLAGIKPGPHDNAWLGI